MRKAFVKAITPILQNDESQVFITGDLGFDAFEELQDTLGKRFINAGVAEQNMVSVAAGMAKMGYRPWVYSITPFATLRCLEQIRNDVCFPNLPVTIVGNGGGFTYGMNGPTHFGLDDIGIMKCLPNMRQWLPCHSFEIAVTVKAMVTWNCPQYLRLGISPYEPQGPRGYPITPKKVTVVGIGQAINIAEEAWGWVKGKKDAPIDVHRIDCYPFTEDHLDKIAKSLKITKKLIIIDEHLGECSLGKDLIIIMQHLVPISSIRFLGNVSYGTANGDSLWHHKRCGLTPEALIRLVQEIK